MSASYPFSAVVGQDDLKLALILVTIDPTIGGVLIRGERGTAKSTTARGLSALLPAREDGTEAPFVELPLGATEDRVIGSLDVAAALRDGRTTLRSGLLARADGGVLYVDEVNLLPDHLVDLLLDSAASGRVTIERDGVSASEAARFILVGSMNPEEGELRPQFLDRFGLAVDVRAPAEACLRTATVRARLEFDADPARFARLHEAGQETLREELVAARRRLLQVTLDDSRLAQAAALCAQMHIDGLRGDIVVAKAARALAAWEEAAEVDDGHLRRAAPFALSHRRRRRPRDPMPSAPTPPPPPQQPASANTPTPTPTPPSLPAPPATPKTISVHLPESLSVPRSGRRAAEQGAGGPAVRSRPWPGAGPVAVAPTVIAAAVRGAATGDKRLALEGTDLRQHERRGRTAARVLILVDASGSMAAQRRLALAKGAVLGLLDSSYQRRDEVGLVIVAGDCAELRLPFTRRVEHAEDALREVPTGGRTPLVHALQMAGELCADTTHSGPALLVLLTDGRANVPVQNGDPWQEALAAARHLATVVAASLVIDCEQGPVRLGRARDLADVLAAPVLPLDEIDEQQLTVRLRHTLDHP